MTTESVLLRVEKVSKRFGPVQAVDDVSIDFRSGEVHCLLGENGAGKSTLAKMIGGAIAPDAGRLLLKGEQLAVGSPAAALERGVSVIWQELSVLPELSVAANIFLGREPRTRWGWLDERAMRRVATGLLEQLGATFGPQVLVGELSVADQQLVEIAAAMNRDASVIIMDEATSALSAERAVHLYQVVDELRAGGACVIYVTHDLEEVFRLGDRATVLKDGVVIDSGPVREMTRDGIVRAMVGRNLEAMFPQRRDDQVATGGGEPALRVSHLTLPPFFHDVTLDVHPGEIVGLAGLVGAGRTALAMSLFGAAPGTAGSLALRGRVAVQGRTVRIRRPSQAVRHGVGLVPEDRKADGLALELSVRDNVAMPLLGRLSRFGVTAPGEESRVTEEVADKLKVKIGSQGQMARGLSGGNQQKLVLGKWLATECRVLVLDEPTRGIDVGSKAEIYAILRNLADEGLAILLISSDLLEILGLSDRILVMRRGRIVAETRHGDASEEGIVRSAIGAE